MTTTETTDREHAAMEAAGASDEDLITTIQGLQACPALDREQYLLLQACWDERENRARARFLDRAS